MKFIKKINTVLLYRFKLFLNKYFYYIKKSFLTFHSRPAFTDNFILSPHQIISDKMFCIIIQGPIDQEYDFTLETIKLYKKIFKNSKIILSTWNDTNENILSKFKQLDIELILNEKPKNPGINHVNYQITSTFSGLHLSKKENFEYSIKTRTDQRIYRPDALFFLRNLIKIFPINSKNQSERILFLDQGSSKFGVYKISDFFMFGKTDDLFNFWNTPKYEDGIIEFQQMNDHKKDPVIISKTLISAEVFLILMYLKVLKIKPDFTLKQWWEIVRENFGIASSTSLDLYWKKHLKIQEYRYIKQYNKKFSDSFDFMDWVNLYLDKNFTSWQGINSPEEWIYLEKNNVDRVK